MLRKHCTVLCNGFEYLQNLVPMEGAGTNPSPALDTKGTLYFQKTFWVLLGLLKLGKHQSIC